MKRKGLKLWLVLLCLMMVQLACWIDIGPTPPDYDAIYCTEHPYVERCRDEGSVDITPNTLLESMLILEPSRPTLETSDIQPVSTPKLTSGACAWVLTSDSDGYPSGEVKEGMRVGEGDINTSLRTYFSHGKSECGEQVFETYHAWYLDDIYYPGKTVNLSVVFSWNNIGTADCASLAMAGGSTALSVGNLQIKAQNSNINIRTNPQGELSDSDTWVVPEGDLGDILTITQNVSTGIYGKNIRWRYEYVCE